MQAKKHHSFDYISEFCKPRIGSWGEKGEADKLVPVILPVIVQISCNINFIQKTELHYFPTQLKSIF